MEQERKSLRIGVLLIGFAVLWRLLAGGITTRVAAYLGREEVAAALLFFPTGRWLRLPDPAGPKYVAAVQVPETAVPEIAGPLRFDPAEGERLSFINAPGYEADLGKAVTEPLSWAESSDPQVLILHTHATESYAPDGTYEESSPYRSLDGDYNMLRVGDELQRELEKLGISVLHDRTLHDYPSYSGSYGASLRTAQAYKERYPGIQVILDLHRDALEGPDGQPVATVTQVNGEPVAQLMMVVGTDAGGLTHPDWRRNLAFGTQLAALLERDYPGINRPVYLRTERFNQHLAPGGMLIEVGSTGNTQQEALRTARLLAPAIAQLLQGTNG